MMERRQPSISSFVIKFSFSGSFPRGKLYNKKQKNFQPIFRYIKIGCVRFGLFKMFCNVLIQIGECLAESIADLVCDLFGEFSSIVV